MIKIGCDICSVSRIKNAYSRFGNRLLERLLTLEEIDYVLSQPAHVTTRLAGRFAAKEAACKALGTGWRGVGFKDFEVIKEPSGAPGLKLHGRAEQIAQSKGLSQWEVSLSHEKEYATACVLAYYLTPTSHNQCLLSADS